MKVMINALGAHKGGALRHLTSFVPALGAEDKTSEYTVLVRTSVNVPAVSRNIRLERVADESASALYARVRHDLVSLPRRLRSESFDVVVSLTNFGPIWSNVRHVLFQRNALYFHNE